MCQLTSSPLCCKCNIDQSSYLINPVSKNPEPDVFTALILDSTTTKTTKQQPQTHFSLAINEAFSIANIALPMILTGLLLYSRSIISMLYLGRLGELPLAGGSLAIGFANITGYSVLSGLAMGMEPICSQAFGAKSCHLVAQRRRILLLCSQDEAIALEAQSYLLYSLPDLFAQSLLHPLRIYLRTQSMTLPLTFCASLSIILHFPINYILVIKLGLGTKGVALSGVWTNFNLVASLILYILVSGIYKKTCKLGWPIECLRGWQSLLNLAIPSCISVCLEWWWYEIMILLCGLFVNPRTTVASMGILIQTTSLIYIFPSSLSFSVSTRVGNKLGANKPAKAKLAAVVGISCSCVLGLSALFFAVSVRNVRATMFTHDKNIIALTSLVLPIIGLCELGNFPQTTGCGVLRGTARPKIAANINLGCFYLVGMPVALGLGFFVGLDFKGLWLGLLAAQASCGVTVLIVTAQTDWNIEAVRAQVLTAGATVDNQNEDEKTVKAENKEDFLC